MSRTSLHRPRRNRAVWHRTASGTRLFTCPFPPNIPLHFPHYKRCPKAQCLSLRSDQSLFPPVYVTGYGRSPDKKRHALSKGPCQVRAALTRRNTLALSGDAHEHGLKLFARAIVPRDSTVVALGEAMPHGDGRESTPPYLRMAGHFWWLRLPHTEITSRLLHVLSEARAVAKSASMWNIRCRGHHPSVQASLSSCATVRDLPSPPPPVPSFPPLYSILPAPEPESIPFCHSTWAVESPPTGSVNPFPPTYGRLAGRLPSNTERSRPRLTNNPTLTPPN